MKRSNLKKTRKILKLFWEIMKEDSGYDQLFREVKEQYQSIDDSDKEHLFQSMIDQIQTEVNHGEDSDPSVAEPDPESKKKVGQP